MNLTFIVGLIAGGLISWGITHLYYRLGSRDQSALYQKLTDDVRSAVLDDARERLGVRELNELLASKTLDWNAKGDPLPFKACPECGDTELRRSSADDPTRDRVYLFIECPSCGWSEWTE